MTIISMTGFGRAIYSTERFSLTVEIKSVNSRFLDLTVRLPPGLQQHETFLSELIRTKIKRGRVEAQVTRTNNLTSADCELQLNANMLEHYFEIYKKSFAHLHVDFRSAVSDVVLDILRRKDVFAGTPTLELDENGIQGLKGAFEAALQQLFEMRQVEGKALENELQKILAELQSLHLAMVNQAKSTALLLKDRLNHRLQSLLDGSNLDQSRLTQEVAILVDKADISEELARLSSHIEQFSLTLQEGGGRKGEFLLQEMGREINTVGSKSQQLELTSTVVTAKSLLEKLREQIMNIE